MLHLLRASFTETQARARLECAPGSAKAAVAAYSLRRVDRSSIAAFWGRIRKAGPATAEDGTTFG